MNLSYKTRKVESIIYRLRIVWPQEQSSESEEMSGIESGKGKTTDDAGGSTKKAYDVTTHLYKSPSIGPSVRPSRRVIFERRKCM